MDRFADLSQADFRPLRNYGDVAHTHRGAILRFQDGGADVVGAGHQADGANIDFLAALLDKAAAGIGVVGRQRLLHLSNRQPIVHQLVRVHLHLVFARQPAEAAHVHYSRDGLELFFQHPVLQ